VRSCGGVGWPRRPPRRLGGSRHGPDAADGRRSRRARSHARGRRRGGGGRRRGGRAVEHAECGQALAALCAVGPLWQQVAAQPQLAQLDEVPERRESVERADTVALEVERAEPREARQRRDGREPVGAQVEHRQPGERLQVQHSFEPVVAHVEELERDERPQRPGGLEAAAAEVEAREGHGQSLERLEADGFVGEVLHGAPLVVRRGGPCVLAATCSLGHAAGCGSEPATPNARCGRARNPPRDHTPPPADRPSLPETGDGRSGPYPGKSWNPGEERTGAKRILQRNSVAQHWARDWRALALTQVHQKEFYGARSLSLGS